MTGLVEDLFAVRAEVQRRRDVARLATHDLAHQLHDLRRRFLLIVGRDVNSKMTV
jgi:hypothetical protein